MQRGVDEIAGGMVSWETVRARRARLKKGERFMKRLQPATNSAPRMTCVISRSGFAFLEATSR
jgi:hypothetical protein